MGRGKNPMDERNTTMKIFTPVLIVLFFVTMIMLMLVYHTMRDDGKIRETAVIKEVPQFSLINQFGKEVTQTDLLGSLWVVNYIFTSCGGTCPAMTFQMRELQRSIPSDMPVKFVSVSVDPERDTPDVLREYAEEWEADADRWLFLTGEKEEIYSLSRDGFLLGISPEGGTLAEPIMHSQRFVLVDAEGSIRGYYDGFDEDEVGLLRNDIFILLNEAS